MTNDQMNFAKVILAGILFIGYYLIIILAFFVGIPPEGANIVLQGIAVVGPIIGMVAANMFPKNEDRTADDQKTITTLVDKVPPVTTHSEEV